MAQYLINSVLFVVCLSVVIFVCIVCRQGAGDAFSYNDSPSPNERLLSSVLIFCAQCLFLQVRQPDGRVPSEW